MVKLEKNSNDKTKGIIEGISLATAFIIGGIILNFIPNYFYFEILSTIMGLLLITFGIIGLSIELSKMSAKTVGFSDLGVGLGLLIVWALLYYYLPYVWVNIVGFFFLLFGLYAAISGMITLIYDSFNNENDRNKIITKIVVILLQLIGFISALLTIIGSI